MGSKICRIIPYDGTREGVTWNMDKAEDQKEVIKFIEQEFKRLKVWQNFMWGWTLARAYGGAVIYMSVNDGRSISQPINWKRVKKIKSLKVIDRHELDYNSLDMISDIGDPKFGTPRVYRYQPSATVTGAKDVIIHHSRIIRFDGIKLPSRLYVENNYWHDSIFGTLATSIRNYSVTHEALSPIVQSIAQPVYKIEGLSEAIANYLQDHYLLRMSLLSAPLCLAYQWWHPSCWSLICLGLSLYIITGGWKTFWIAYMTVGRDAR